GRFPTFDRSRPAKHLQWRLLEAEGSLLIVSFVLKERIVESIVQVVRIANAKIPYVHNHVGKRHAHRTLASPQNSRPRET
ncbi:MAG TPA: hypothetical protein VGM27_33505, partial [Acidobacteriaceae bacterium]